MSEEKDPEFLTVDQLATRWRMSDKTIYALVGAGKLSFATKLGGSWRFPQEKVEEYEESQMVGEV